MERERKDKNIAIIALFVAVVTLSIAFAATLSTTLNINGTVTIPDIQWDVHFDTTNATLTPTTTGSVTVNSGPLVTASTVSYNVTLTENSSFSFTVDVVNDGNMTAKVDTLTVAGAENYTGLVTYSFSGLAVNDTIAAGNSQAVTVTVSMGEITNQNVDKIENGTQLTLTVVADFVPQQS